MRIVFAASECVPFAKTGGLADVVGALAPEVAKLGHEVTVYLPLYARVRPHIEGELKYAAAVDHDSVSVLQPVCRDCGRGHARRRAVLLCGLSRSCSTGRNFTGRRAGDYPDNAERFGLFCRAVLEATKQLGVPDVFHVHDWQAALVPVYLRTVYASDPVLRRCCGGVDDSQRGVPGEVSAGDDGAAAAAVGYFHDGQAGAVRSASIF